MTSYKLTYFHRRGRAEVLMLLMAYGDIKFEDLCLTKEEWAKVKPTTPFGQVPILEVDGVQISQSQAISRFLAKKVGLYGTLAIDEAKIDMVIGCLEDCLKSPGLTAVFYERDETKKRLTRKTTQDSLEAGLKKMESLVTGDYFVGNQMSWADISVSERVRSFIDMGFDVKVDKTPRLASLMDRVESHPIIAAWIAKQPELPSIKNEPSDEPK